MVSTLAGSERRSIEREPEGTPAISTRGLTKEYDGERALTAVSLDVRPGEVFGYLGPNGAGKTTTIRLLMGLIRPSAGTATVLGLDAWRDATTVHARLGYVPGDPQLYERMTGRDLLTYLSSLRGRKDRAYADELAVRLDVDLDRTIHQLSKGNRQKIVLIQALMSRPDLLVLDEPTTGLDPLVQQVVHDVLREHAARGGTVFLSSHVLSEVQSVADRVAIIRKGRVVAVERLDDLRNKSLHRLDVRVADRLVASEFDDMAEVHDLVVTGDRMTCGAPQVALDQLVKRLAAHRIVDLSCEEASLEDTFLAYYAGDGEAVSSGAS